MITTIKDLLPIKSIFEAAPAKIIIFTHDCPDGDALGASLALMHYLKQWGHTITVAIPNDYHNFLSFMPNINEVLIYYKNKKEILTKAEEASIGVFVDLNTFSRLEKMEKEIKKIFSDKTKILFDHHLELLKDEFDLFFWDSQASSTSELVYDFIVSSGNYEKITPQIAECIYVGIITDTHSLSYGCNNERTYLVLSHLTKFNINLQSIYQKIFKNFSYDQIKLFGYSLYYKLKIFPEKKLAYIALSYDELKRFNYISGSTEGLVNYTVSINNIKLGVLLREEKNHINISFRSVGDVDVNKIAKELFNGGGHKNAAGADFYGTLQEACRIIENIEIN